MTFDALTIVVGFGCTLLGAWISTQNHKRNLVRDTAADAQVDGELRSDIRYIKESLSELKGLQKEQRDGHIAVIERLTKVEASASSAHKRLDGIGAPSAPAPAE